VPLLVSRLMAMIAFVLKPDLTEPGWFYLFLGGMVGSAAMILPGISGSYMLLIMGLYLPIIAGVSEFKEALQGRDLALLLTVGTNIILPVGLGLVAGLVLLSNLLKYLLRAWHKPTIGFLLGLLLGSVLGLYPFQEPSFDKLPRYAVLTEEGKKDPLFRDLEERLRVFHLHGETVELTLSMKLLGRGKHCENQVVKIGSHAYGLQCHFELTKTMFHLWLQEDADLAGLDQEFLRAEFQALEREYTQVGRRLMENFLKSAGI